MQINNKFVNKSNRENINLSLKMKILEYLKKCIKIIYVANLLEYRV